MDYVIVKITEAQGFNPPKRNLNIDDIGMAYLEERCFNPPKRNLNLEKMYLQVLTYLNNLYKSLLIFGA